MDEYKFQQRRKKRGDHCVMAWTDKNGVGQSKLCGCGARTPPTKKHKKRIVRRFLQNLLLKEER